MKPVFKSCEVFPGVAEASDYAADRDSQAQKTPMLSSPHHQKRELAQVRHQLGNGHSKSDWKNFQSIL